MRTLERILIVFMIICTLNYLNGCTKKVAISSQEFKPDSKYRMKSIVRKDSSRADLPSVVRSEIQDSLLLVHTNKQIPMQIPVSEIDTIVIKKFSYGRTALLVLGIPVGIMLIAALTSCPYVYSFDGQQYAFDGEPYGGSTCEGLERVDFVQLDNLKAVNNEFKILVTNELNESQYTNEFKLWVIDHPRGVQVIPDTEGNLYTVMDPDPCLEAIDQQGRDFTSWLKEKDDQIWQSEMNGKDGDKEQDLRDTLFLTFPFQEHAIGAKLIVNGCNTLWGSFMLRKVLDLYGREVDTYLESFKDPDFRTNNLEWHKREEVFRLQVKVWTGQEWQVRGEVLGGGPLKAESRIVPLDLSGITGEQLRIMLTPPTGFWQLNHFAIDYSNDLPFSMAELSPEKAVDHNGQEIGSTLDDHDDRYYIMPETGNHGILTFDVPAEQEEMQRTILAKISGYYDIHLKAEGDMDLEKINNLAFTPGFIAKYSLDEFGVMQEKLVSQIDNQ